MGHPRLREHKQLPCQLPGGRVPSPLFLRIFFALHTTAAELVSCRHDGRGDPAIEHVKKVASHLWMFRAKDLGFAATAVRWLRLVTAREVAPPKPWRPLLKAREIAVGCIFSASKGPLQAPLRCPSAQRGRQTLGPPCTPRPCTLCPSGATANVACTRAVVPTRPPEPLWSSHTKAGAHAPRWLLPSAPLAPHPSQRLASPLAVLTTSAIHPLIHTHPSTPITAVRASPFHSPPLPTSTMAFVVTSPALLRAARSPATSSRRPAVAAARVAMMADPQTPPSSEGPVTSGVPPARNYPVRH